MGQELIRRIAILGPGLLGGSVALGIRAFFPAVDLSLWGRSEHSVAPIRESSLLADALISTNVEEVVNNVDLVILATPIGVMPELAKQILKIIKPECLVSDVGSVKSRVHEALDPLFFEAKREFVGSHPMAGAEVQGFLAARHDLFHNAPVAVTSGKTSTRQGVWEMMEFWKTLGGKSIEFSPQEHDEAVARVSHLTHCLSALTALCATNGQDNAAILAGPGFRDTSRVSAGDPGMWQEILRENRNALIPALKDANFRLSELISLLEKDSESGIQNWLFEARQHRLALQDRWNRSVFTEDEV